jgi:hypothetical protein
MLLQVMLSRQAYPNKERWMSEDKRGGASKGGEARAASLTAAERKRIAVAGAEARWGKSLPVAQHTGVLKIGDLEFPCAVLSDGTTRVLTQTDFMRGMGMYYSGWVAKNRSPEDHAAEVPHFLSFKSLKPFVDRHLGDLQSIIIKYRTEGGNVAHGIKAEIIPKICDVWIDAEEEGKLGSRQKLIAGKARILMRALAHVGITALVDEATGFQEVRSRDALAQILEAFVQDELKKWVRTFPTEFYRELYRLRGLAYPPEGTKMPPYFGHLTNNIVYDRLAPGVKDELKRLTPRDAKGRHRQKLFQRLTDDVGSPRLREHLASTVALMKISDNYEEFEGHLNKALPKWDDTLPLALNA